MSGLPLSIARAEPQGEFPWMEAGHARCLSFPPEDFALWNGRDGEIKNPGFLAVRFDFIFDPRFGRLRSQALNRNVAFNDAVMTLWMAAGYALRMKPAGYLQFRGKPTAAAEIAVQFGMDPNECEGWINKGLAACHAAGWFELVGIEEISEAARPRAAALGRARPSACRQTDRQTDREEETSPSCPSAGGEFVGEAGQSPANRNPAEPGEKNARTPEASAARGRVGDEVNPQQRSAKKKPAEPEAGTSRELPEAARMLVEAGFGEKDARGLARAGLEQVRIAVANAEFLDANGRIRQSKRGYIADCIRHGWSLDGGLAKDRDSAGKRDQAAREFRRIQGQRTAALTWWLGLDEAARRELTGRYAGALRELGDTAAAFRFENDYFDPGTNDHPLTHTHLENMRHLAQGRGG